MRLLAIDTSGQACSLALFEDGHLIAERHEVIGRGHAEIILPWIAGLPDGGRADRIIVGCGPGSFTGIRVGVAAARALGLGWSAPVEGVSSLALIAAGAEPGQPVLVVIEGGHGEVFVQPFDTVPLSEAGPVASMTVEAAAARYDLPAVIGNAAERLVVARGYGEAIACDPRAGLAGDLPASILRIVPTPVYARGPDAKAA